MKAAPIPVVGLLLLLGMAPPSQAADHLVGGYSEASVTNTEVVAAAQFAVNAQALSVQRGPAISVVEILSAQQQVVAGMNYRLRMKVKVNHGVDGIVREAEVVVWRKLSGEHELTSWAWSNQPDEAMLNRLHKGMLVMQFEQVVGKTAKPRPNPTPHDSVADYDFDGWCIIADVDNSPVAPAATVRDYTVVRDGLTIRQRQAERAKNWSAWLAAHQRNTNEAEFVYTVGTDTNGVPMQQVEWLYRKADLKEQQCPIWAGSLVNMGMEENGAVRVQCDKTALPDEQKWHQFILKGNIVTGWLKKDAIIKVKMSDWKTNRPQRQ